MHFKKLRDILSKKISEIEILLLCCLKHSFFGSLDELKKHQLCKLLAIRMPKHMLSISCKHANKLSSQFDAANSMHRILFLQVATTIAT